MIIDHQNNKTNGKEIIEYLIFDENNPKKTGVWIMASASSLHSVSRVGDIHKVFEIRVRNLDAERTKKNKRG